MVIVYIIFEYKQQRCKQILFHCHMETVCNSMSVHFAASATLLKLQVKFSIEHPFVRKAYLNFKRCDYIKVDFKQASFLFYSIIELDVYMSLIRKFHHLYYLIKYLQMHKRLRTV